jgi:uncharacterized protein (DUF2141 family)
MAARVCGVLALSVLIAALTATPTLGQSGSRLVVVVRGLRNDVGFVKGALFTSADDWLREGSAAEDCHARIRHGSARCVFTSVPHRQVAFAALHDEDGDGEFDRNLLGLPEEGYAFSNDVREAFGPPSFAAASFLPSRHPFVVHVRYGI